MELQKIIEGLHPLERKVLPHIKSAKSEEELANKAGLQHVEAVRALQWLETKGIVFLQKHTEEQILLGAQGAAAIKDGLPEKKFLLAVAKKPLSLNDVAKEAKLDPQEVNICIGLLRRKQLITLDDKKVITITPTGKDALNKPSLEEQFLAKLAKGSLAPSTLKDEEKLAYQELQHRKALVQLKSGTRFTFSLTPLGEKAAKEKITVDVIDRLTSAHLAEGSWKGKALRRYDVSVPVAQPLAGKRHFVREVIDYTKKLWLEMGFTEMEGPLLQTSFWNFDALYTAQDHPGREMHDTFFIEDPAKGKLPDKKLVSAVKSAHENGGGSGSTGYRGVWSSDEAQRNVLRTHTTPLSAQTLATLAKGGYPAKYFSVGICFRNETLDWSHLFEFHQTEGIVIDKNATFQHLLGYLREFYKKMGFEHVRFRPGYFPYTEPSLEVDVFHPVHQKWIELGGAGIFRPEVVVPLLGEDIPVLAWGQGIGRVLMDYYKLTDIRDLNKNDLKQLREIKGWIKCQQ